MRRASFALIAATAATLTTAGAATAQECLGLPTRDGDVALAGTAGGFQDDAHFGAEFTADVSGPAAFAFSYGAGGGDDDRQMFTGRASYDFYLVEPAVCVVAGVLYDDAPGGLVEERWGVPLGFGFGKTLRSDDLTTTVFAVPQYVFVREQRLEGLELDTETDSEFMGEAGVTLGFRPFFLGGSVVVSSFDDDAAFRIRGGLLF